MGTLVHVAGPHPSVARLCLLQKLPASGGQGCVRRQLAAEPWRTLLLAHLWAEPGSGLGGSGAGVPDLVLASWWARLGPRGSQGWCPPTGVWAGSWARWWTVSIPQVAVCSGQLKAADLLVDGAVCPHLASCLVCDVPVLLLTGLWVGPGPGSNKLEGGFQSGIYRVPVVE